MRNYKVIKSNGKPEFVLVPYADFIRLIEAERNIRTRPQPVKKKDVPSDKTKVPEEVSRRLRKGESPFKAWRLYRDMTQADVAKEAGVSKAIVSLVENRKKVVKPETIDAIARVLGIPLRVLKSQPAARNNEPSHREI